MKPSLEEIVDRWLQKTTVNNVTRLSNVSRAYVLVVRRVPCTVAHRAAWEASLQAPKATHFCVLVVFVGQHVGVRVVSPTRPPPPSLHQPLYEILGLSF